SSFGTNGGLSIEQAIGLLTAPINPDATNSLFSVTVTGTGPGRRALVRIWSGDVDAARNLPTPIPTRHLLYSLYPFRHFPGGVYVRTGDFNGDGFLDLACSTGAGTTGRVKIYTFQSGGIQLLANIMPFGPNYTGGVEVAKGAYLTGLYPDPTGNTDPFGN